MQEVLLIVHDPEKVKYAATLAREMTEKLAGQNIKVTLFADGNSASRMLINEERKLQQVKAAGGEVVSCVHDIQDADIVSSLSTVIRACLTDIERREKQGAEVMHV